VGRSVSWRVGKGSASGRPDLDFPMPARVTGNRYTERTPALMGVRHEVAWYGDGCLAPDKIEAGGFVLKSLKA